MGRGRSAGPTLTGASVTVEAERETVRSVGGSAGQGVGSARWEDQRWTLSRVKTVIGRRFHLACTIQGVRSCCCSATAGSARSRPDGDRAGRRSSGRVGQGGVALRGRLTAARGAWRMLHLRRAIAAVAGVPQRLLSKVVRVSYAKVAEYQQRGLIHFHAVIRLDGPAGPFTPPPAWATPDLLADAIRIAATRARIDGPEVNGRARAFVFGEQIDTRIIRSSASRAGPRSPRARSPDTSPSTPPRAPKPRPAPSTTV